MHGETEAEIEQLDWVPVPPELQEGLSRQSLSRKRLRTWMLVLEARNIPCRNTSSDGNRQLLVPVTHYRQACRELKEYEHLNRNWPPPPPAAQKLRENTASTLWVLILLAAFHNVAAHNFNPFGSGSLDWYQLGTAHAQKILDGQWWRLVTALTLHSGPLHLIGNIIIGGVFIVQLCRLLGAGKAWFLILWSGILGNLINAFLQAPEHRSIGASTAIFGAVGLLAMINTLHHRLSLWRRWPLPLAAAFGLLGLLGTGGENTDIGAHLFGFLAGLLLGLINQKLLSPAIGWNQSRDFAMAVATVALVLTAWGMALTFASNTL